jgi:adenylosuccinate synthase
LRGQKLNYPPATVAEWEKCRPIYRSFRGWETDTTKIKNFRRLPSRAQQYLRAIADLTGAKLKIVSVGAQRDQTMWL